MAANTPYMGLKVWNQLTDSYDHTQLGENFAKLDQHDHSEGKGVQVPTGGIANGAISTAKIGDGQITAAKLATGAAESGGINTPERTYRAATSTEGTYTNSTTSYSVVDSASVYVPANARLMVSYFALQKATTEAGSIALFIDEVEVKKTKKAGAPEAIGALSLAASTIFGYVLTVTSVTEVFGAVKGETSDTSLVTTGTLAPPPVGIWGLTAGTHKVEVKAKAGSGGKVEMKNRTLWVRTESFS